MANPFFGSSGYHVMCYSRSFKSGFIGTNVKTLENLFGYLDAFFGTTINKIVVVKTEKIIIRDASAMPVVPVIPKPVAGVQLMLGL